MAFIKFTEHGRSYEAKASISQTGMISFSDGARKRFIMDDKGMCVLYYDPDTKKIGIELTSDKTAEGARRIRLRNTGADIAAKGFLQFFNICVKETMLYTLELDDNTGYLVIDMSKGKARMNRSAKEDAVKD